MLLHGLPWDGSASSPPARGRELEPRAAHGSVPFMRKQYHLWPADTGFDAWDVDRLISLSRGLPVHAVTVDSVREVDTVYCFDGSTAAPAVRAVVEHARLMLDADFVLPDGSRPRRTGEGRDAPDRPRHARRQEKVSAVRFPALPEPDYRDCQPADLPY
jgi:hypothetical protein